MDDWCLLYFAHHPNSQSWHGALFCYRIRAPTNSMNWFPNAVANQLVVQSLPWGGFGNYAHWMDLPCAGQANMHFSRGDFMILTMTKAMQNFVHSFSLFLWQLVVLVILYKLCKSNWSVYGWSPSIIPIGTHFLAYLCISFDLVHHWGCDLLWFWCPR